MKYSMTISEDIIENGPEWKQGLEPLLEDAVDTFCSAVVSKVSAAIIKSIPAPYSIDCTLQQRILYGLQYEDDYCDWAEERVKALLTQAEANVEHLPDTYNTVRVSWTFEVNLAGVELAMSDLQNFLVEKRGVTYRPDSDLSFWDWYKTTQRGLANDTYSSARLADSDVLHVTEQRPYPDLSDEEDDNESEETSGRIGDIPERYSAPLSVFQSGWPSRCVWISPTNKRANKVYTFWHDLNMAVKAQDYNLSLEFLNGSTVRFTSLDHFETLRGCEFDYAFVDGIDLNSEEWKREQWVVRFTGGKVVHIPEEEPEEREVFTPNGWITLNGTDRIPARIDVTTSNCTVAPGYEPLVKQGYSSWSITINEAMKVEEEDWNKAQAAMREAVVKAFDIAPQQLGSPDKAVEDAAKSFDGLRDILANLGSSQAAVPYPGPSKPTDKEETTKTEPLTNVREPRSLFGWLREDKACAYGGYEVIPTDLGTFHILLWGSMDYCASDIDDLKAHAKKIEDKAWQDERPNPFPLDEEVWEWSNGK